MSQAVAYGSISIVDLTDLGEFSVQPMSNMPLSVIYDPDNQSFTPNWGTNNLTVTPSIYYAGKELALGSTGLTVTWQRQAGSDAYTALATGESIVDNGKLRVTTNKFTANSTMLTYIVTATYTEPTTQQQLTAKGQITFSLIKNATKVKDCIITGESVFKYDTSGAIVGGNNGVATITLTANVSNVSITGWKYQNSGGTWTTYPNSGTATTLTISSNDSVFVNDKCVIKCETNDSSVFDIHTITNLRDGAPGSTTVSAVLTNDSQMVPFSGNTGDFSSAVSRIIIYQGGADDTINWTITQTSTGVAATPSTTTKTNDTTTVTAFGNNVSTGNVTFTCKKAGFNDIVKTFSLVKVSSGADGVSPTIYSVETETLAMNKAIGGTLTPESVTYKFYKQTGGSKTSYSGRCRIYENITYQDYEAYTATQKTNNAKYASSSDESSGYHTYTPSASATSVLCVLYQSGALTSELDSQMTIITSDGQTGAQGPQGKAGADAINIVFGNYSDVLNCTSDNKLIANQTLTIPFKAFKGTTQVACTGPTAANIKLAGVKHSNADITPTVTNSTASAEGSITWTLAAGDSVTVSGGTINCSFTVSGKTVTQTYTWTRTTAATNGQNAVLLQVFTPSGTNVFNQSVTSITMQAQLMEGSTDKTTSATYQWAKWTNGSYSNVSGATSSSLAVSNSSVDSYASYRCTATYTPTGGTQKTYTAYFSLFDKTDPIQVSVLSSIGEQIINGQGTGAFYVKVTRLGQEVDPLRSDRFLTDAPASPSTGDFYYHLDSTNKTVTLKKYSGSAWANATGSDLPQGTYEWTWRDKDGNAIPTVSGYQQINGINLPKTGKVVYIDGSMVDTKIIADVGVTIS